MPGSRLALNIGGFRMSIPNRDPKSMPTRKVRIPGLKDPLRIPKVNPVEANARGLMKDRNLRTRERDGIFIVTRRVYRHNEPTQADDITGQEFEKRCLELDQAPAGKRARDLLFRYLSDDQRKQVEMYNYFDVVILHPWNHWVFEQFPEKKRYGWTIPHVTFRIYRGKAIANVEMFIVNGSGTDPWPEPDYLLCIQSREPLPTDDICLAQKFMIEGDPNLFLRTAVVYNASPMFQIRFTTLFHPPWRYSKFFSTIELPYIKDLAQDRSWQRRSRREQVLALIDRTLDYAESS